MEDEASAYNQWAECYDLTMGDRNSYISFYSRFIGEATRSLIDMGCGTGVIMHAIANRLYALTDSPELHLVGLDGSREMLQIARQRDHRIHWILGDLRTFRIAGTFDLAISCYNTLQHLNATGLAQAFASARSVLRPGGLFVFDIYQPNLPYLLQPQRNRLARSLTDENRRSLEIREDSTYDAASNVLTLEWRLVEKGRDRAPLVRTRYRMWQHSAEDVARLLSGAGFSIRERFGDLDGAPFDSTSKKQIVVSEST
jgi:SAM-dependent methyltransferase